MPSSALPPGFSSAIETLVSPFSGIQRSWTLRNHTIPFGP
jgi:hypothetical protein